MKQSEYLIAVGAADVQRMDAMSEIFNAQSLAWLDEHLQGASTPHTPHTPQGASTPHTLLDVGCGNGCLTVPLAQRHRNVAVLGVDISAEQLQLAEAAAAAAAVPNASFEQLDARTLAPTRQFDVVHARFLLTNLPEPVALADRLLACVKPGGRLVLQESHGFDFALLAEDEAAMPRALKAWQQVVRLQHQLQGSHLDTGARLQAHFASADSGVMAHSTACSVIAYSTARGVIDTPSKKRLFIEGAKQALGKMRQLEQAGTPLPAEIDPLQCFGYASGAEWLKELEQVQHDDAMRFAWTVACLVVRKQ